jgi:acetolactate synthase I/II/III large subunit
LTKLSGGDVLVRSLRQHGATCAFTLCGNHLLSTYDAAIGSGLRLVDVRHESAAAHMADAWARVTGAPGVCLVTGGPGHTNAITGIATANGADSPVIWISGGSEAEFAGQGAMQEIDQVAIARPVTKWSAAATSIREIPRLVANAYRVAQTGRPGPVHLTLPVDIMDAVVDEDSLAFPPAIDWKLSARTDPNPDLVDQALGLLATARRPVVVAAAGAWWSGAGPALHAFAERTAVPIFTIDTARGLISDDHPACFGYADPLLNPAATLFSQADVALVLGRRLDYRLRYGGVFPRDCKLIQVDAEPADIGASRPADLAIAGSPAAVLDQMAAKATTYRWDTAEWRAALAQARADGAEKRQPFERSDVEPLHPLRLVRAVHDALPDDYCLTFDAGDFIQWARQGLPARRPSRWLRLGPMATLGCAIPFAIAAKLARPESTVFALTGDGGVGFYGFELDTAVRHNVPFVLVVANDAAWGMEKNLQIGIYGRERVTAADLLPTRYDEVARALGAWGEHVDRAADLEPALRRAVASGRPAVLDITAECAPSSTTDASVRRKLARR